MNTELVEFCKKEIDNLLQKGLRCFILCLITRFTSHRSVRFFIVGDIKAKIPSDLSKYSFIISSLFPSLNGNPPGNMLKRVICDSTLIENSTIILIGEFDKDSYDDPDNDPGDDHPLPRGIFPFPRPLIDLFQYSSIAN
ncbi:hypothetical protein H5410_004776, partial [Solanum commersonii]